MESKKIAIIGAGFGGMTAALDLIKEGFDVTIFEGTGGPGGWLPLLGDGRSNKAGRAAQ